VVPQKPHMSHLPIIWIQQGSDLLVIFKEAIKVRMHSVESEFGQDELDVEMDQGPVAFKDVNRETLWRGKQQQHLVDLQNPHNSQAIQSAPEPPR
jgi:hypothetical protein